MFTNFPTNEEGGFWHKKIYPNEMWLDSIYMAETFLIKYGTMNALCGAYCQDTPVAQATLLASHVRLDSGLLLQGWDYDHNAAWCLEGCAGATGTGLSPEVWSRGLGWYSAALVDILEYLPETHAGRSKLLTLLQGIASGLKQNQDVTSGMWCQVVDKCALSDNWPESSGTGLLVYALKTGVDRGYLDTSYLDVANKAWSGLKANKIGSDAYGPIINDSADGMSIQSSYANYVAIAKKANSYHGLCAIMLAAAAMEY
jgi:unsaturated rhamnogalacturonyl hydrolase